MLQRLHDLSTAVLLTQAKLMWLQGLLCRSQYTEQCIARSETIEQLTHCHWASTTMVILLQRH
jgi:hypothetical protein